ncbi:MAG: carbohydrate binding domain-containing protein [Opitutales bacterium]|nr:carbohydrate binding domain-containing protein [Opitutales bacterium]
MPWNDAEESATDASYLLRAPAGVDGWISPDAYGHLQNDRGRVRFWGVNVVASACFPTHAEADAIASRMAKFGFNCVRFHHLEQTWSLPTLLDYSTGGSRTMSATSLDALHYFESALKARGIYWNLNLHVARRFSSADGLPEAIDSVDWTAQKGIALVDPDMIELQKDYARQLLLTVNPYTGLAPAVDPALAVVEISNENGLIQTWMGGGMDAWPEVFRTQVQEAWNTWLQNRYASDQEMLDGWGIVNEELGAEMLVNGSFASGISSWTLEEHNGADATATTGSYSGRAGVRIAVTTAGTEDWHVQFGQSGLSVTEGQVYTLSFWARADSAMSVSMVVSMAHDPWSSLFNSSNALTTAWQYYEIPFQARITDANVRVLLGGMGASVCNVYLGNVSLKTGGNTSGLPEGATLASGNIPMLESSATYSNGEYSDWCRFLEEKETAYWVQMRDYIRNDIGYQGLIVGTIISTSTPNIQSNMDVIDSHSYWKHPVFPNNDWSISNWTVENESMVNERGGILGSLAAQRVKGKPFFVTEYMHCSPNTFSSEAPLLLSAYAGLQDWDGVFFFQYGNEAHDWNRGYFSTHFDMDQHPNKMANALIGSLMFLREDVAPAEDEYTLLFNPEREHEIVSTLGTSWNIANGQLAGFDNATPLISRVSLSVGASASGLTEAPAAPSASVPFASDTGELVWDLSNSSAGVVSVDTPSTKAIIGYTDGDTYTFANGIEITPGSTEQGWSTIAMSSITGSSDSLYGGTRMIVVATGNAANTNMQWTSADKVSVGANWGASPSLVERIPASITLPVPPARVLFRSLDVEGNVLNELSAVAGADASSSVITLGTESTLWYEVEILEGDTLSAYYPEDFLGAKWTELGWVDDTYFPWVFSYTNWNWTYLYDGVNADTTGNGYWIAYYTPDCSSYGWGYVIPGEGWWCFTDDMSEYWLDFFDPLPQMRR